MRDKTIIPRVFEFFPEMEIFDLIILKFYKDDRNDDSVSCSQFDSNGIRNCTWFFISACDVERTLIGDEIQRLDWEQSVTDWVYGGHEIL